MAVGDASANFLFLRIAIEAFLVAGNHANGRLRRRICRLDANGGDVFLNSIRQSRFGRNMEIHCRNLRPRKL